MNRKVTIIDIAQKSGVSLSTVSLVLNNKPGVSQDTRSRVLAAASDLGYPLLPNSSQGRSTPPNLTTIGMLVKTDPDIPPQANPFYSKVIIGIEDACRRKGINLLFATLPVDENNRPAEVPQLLVNSSVDGLLLVGIFVDESFSSLSGRLTPPVVLVDGYSNTDHYDTVVSDNFHAAYHAVDYLIQKGHRRIGLLGSDPNSYPSLIDRRNGYLRAMKENDLSETFISNFNINKSKGYQEAQNLLAEHSQITALFCLNDDVGSAAIRAAKDLGRRVPEDLSIIGYDDTYIAANTTPALTTVHVDTVAMGRAAVHLLALRLENPDSAPMTLTIHTKLVVRESTSSIANP
jgi:LacI family transcriptional regulator